MRLNGRAASKRACTRPHLVQLQPVTVAVGQRAADPRAELTGLQQLQQGLQRSHHLSLLGGNRVCMLGPC